MDRLAPQDLMGLSGPARHGWSQDIGALVLLDGRGLFDSDGQFRIAAVRARVEQRLHLVPRFRQVVRRAWPLGWPVWVDDAAFDITQHVHALVLGAGAGADEATVLLACESLRHHGLDDARPLWEMWFLIGLADHRVALFLRVSHAVADGASGVAAMSAFVDFTADAAAEEPPRWVPRAAPRRAVLVWDGVRWRLRGAARALAALTHPMRVARQAHRVWPALREVLDGRAPRLSLNDRPIGSNRSLAIIRGDLAEARRIAHAAGGSINDVLLAAVAGGMRELLLARGESVDGLHLRAMVPVSLHGSRPAHGNADSAMVVPLPVGEADAGARLRQIARDTAVRKTRVRPPGDALFRARLLQRVLLHVTAHQRFFNTYVANVPGPPVRLYLAGAEMLEAFPVVPLIGNIAVGIGALSYAGQFNITVVVDRDLCPDIAVLTAGIRNELERLPRMARAGLKTGAA